MSRASSQKINAELFSLEPTALLEFFVIYYNYVDRPDDKLYIHGGTNGINGSVYWQGVEYLPFPIQSSGFESKGDGSLPRPKLSVSNQDFFVSNLIRRYNNLVGAKVVRKRTFVKFLDNQNFSDGKNPYSSADPTAGLEDQVFFILRRSSENRAMVEFELASPLELENVNFPKRSVMARYCGFHYRGNGCRYVGPPVADENDMRLRNPIELKSGLLRRRYSTADGTAPSDTSSFTSKIAAATFQQEDIVTGISLYSGENYYLEFFGYFRVDAGQAGEYWFGVDPDDAAEIFVNGTVVAGDYGAGGQVGYPQGNPETKIYLTEGYHRILIRYYEQGGDNLLTIYYKTPGTASWVSLPSSRYYYNYYDSGVLTSAQRFFSSGSLYSWIGLNSGSSNGNLNRGLWAAGTTYRPGDYVYIQNNNIKVAKKDINDSPNWTPLLKFYICTKGHTSSGSKDPSFNKEYWVADQCSKTINGCRLRFESQGYLPFGGFPGTEEYSISAQ